MKQYEVNVCVTTEDGRHGSAGPVMAYMASEVDARIAELEKALRELDGLYTSVWDRVDGALVLFPDSIPRFEVAHEKAQRALMER